MNSTMVSIFNSMPPEDRRILTEPAADSRRIVYKGPTSAVFSYVQHFLSVYPVNSLHVGYQIISQLHAELLLLSPTELRSLRTAPSTRAGACSYRPRLAPETVQALCLLNATPFMMYAVQRYLPDVHCLYCSNYVPIPSVVRPVSMHPGILDLYRGPALFTRVFPDFAFCCYNRVDAGTPLRCRYFYARLIKLGLLSRAVFYAQRVGGGAAVPVLQRVRAEVAQCRGAVNPLK